MVVRVHTGHESDETTALQAWFWTEAENYAESFHPDADGLESLKLYFIHHDGVEEFSKHCKEVHGLTATYREILNPFYEDFPEEPEYLFVGYEVEEDEGLTRLLLSL